MAMKITYLNGNRFYSGFLAGGSAVSANQDYLNSINVFPFADADTGTNLTVTLRECGENCTINTNLKSTITSLADSALMYARGNSGIIFAQYLYGLGKELPDLKKINTSVFAESAQKAVRHMYEAIMEPVEGTIITVIREWANALLEGSLYHKDFVALFNDALTTAKKSLNQTTNRLEILRKYGVVDAGAKGFVSFLEGINQFIHTGKIKKIAQESQAVLVGVLKDETYAKNRYCVEVILRDCSENPLIIRELFFDYGDSLIVAGTKDKIHFHMHTADPASLFLMLRKHGRITESKVEDMFMQNQITHRRKYKIGLITDSACDLPQEIMDNYQIQMIPFRIGFKEEQFRDKLTIDSQNFYKLLRNEKNHPISSQPSPAQIKSTYEKSEECYKEVISVHISEHLSGVYETAKSLSQTQKSTEYIVINSRNLSVSQGLIVLRIAEAIAEGKNLKEIKEQVEGWINSTTILTDISTLDYMVRGGRISPVKGKIAYLLNLKPIVSLDKTGKGYLIGKSIFRNRNMNKILKIVSSLLAKNKLRYYAIVHADAEKRAHCYAEKMIQLTGKEPEYIMPLSPVVGVHNGIGAVAVGLMFE